MFALGRSEVVTVRSFCSIVGGDGSMRNRIPKNCVCFEHRSVHADPLHGVGVAVAHANRTAGAAAHAQAMNSSRQT